MHKIPDHVISFLNHATAMLGAYKVADGSKMSNIMASYGLFSRDPRDPDPTKLTKFNKN